MFSIDYMKVKYNFAFLLLLNSQAEGVRIAETGKEQRLQYNNEGARVK